MLREMHVTDKRNSSNVVVVIVGVLALFVGKEDGFASLLVRCCEVDDVVVCSQSFRSPISSQASKSWVCHLLACFDPYSLSEVSGTTMGCAAGGRPCYAEPTTTVMEETANGRTEDQ